MDMNKEIERLEKLTHQQAADHANLANQVGSNTNMINILKGDIKENRDAIDALKALLDSMQSDMSRQFHQVQKQLSQKTDDLNAQKKELLAHFMAEIDKLRKRLDAMRSTEPGSEKGTASFLASLDEARRYKT
jgi:chromosome segregation ATPase